MRAAYADPPYFGLAAKFYGEMHPAAADYDRLETHADLIAGLSRDHEAWALSLHTPSLKHILPLCPDDVRVAAWVKPFASYKPNVNPGYCWEPVIFRGGRAGRGRRERTVRDYVAAGITLKRGFCGAKPAAFCWWVFDFLGLEPGDELVDVFPGSGAVGRAWSEWCRVKEGFPLGALVAAGAEEGT